MCLWYCDVMHDAHQVIRAAEQSCGIRWRAISNKQQKITYAKNGSIAIASSNNTLTIIAQWQ